MNIQKLDKIKGCLVGLAIGDALGVHLEFTNPKDVVPITDYTEGNPYGIPKGYWTDDTSMALCISQSLLQYTGFNAEDIMKKFCDWQRKGYMSSTGRCFDIGNTTRNALMEYWRDPNGGPFRGATDVMSAGNGSIMRLAPIPMFFHESLPDTCINAGLSSRITHGNLECVYACQIMGEVIYNMLNNIPWYLEPYGTLNITQPNQKYWTKTLLNVIDGSFGCDDIKKQGTGYVVESLEASLWAVYDSDSFEESVLKAVNLGDDADTTGAVTGQLAGALYGYDAIPQRFKDGLHEHDMIVKIAEELACACRR